MAERSTHQSFVLRIYRFDPAESQKLTGVIEAIDGSGAKASFTDTSGLTETLSALLLAGTGPAARKGAEKASP